MAQIIEDPDCIIEILNIRIEDLRGALVDLLHAVCGEKGFAEAVRRDSGRIYPWPALELAEAKALAALDKENDPKTVPAG
jgi:hypothetical protein